MDCDDFKRVNDEQGHAAGDALLRSVARTLAEGVRKTDLPARLGGVEFMVLVPETDAAHSERLVEHLRASLAEAMRAGRWPVTFSIGLAVFDRTPASPDAAVEFADRLMYRAKRSGKDQAVRDSWSAVP
jgi:diguanylate cyclase (GGDEF)-like protein